MPILNESNIILNFPTEKFFRLADCTGYRSLSGNYFKEMDACWYDATDNLYWLFELKDFSLATLTTAETIEKRSWDIAKKAIDSLCMFLSSRHGYAYAANLNPCFPFIPNKNTKFKFITVVHCDSTQKPDIQLLNEKFKIKFKPYAELFGITNYSVLEHSRAKEIIPYHIIH